MGIWDDYRARLETAGETKRDRALKRTQTRLNNKLKDSLSYRKVLIDDIPQYVSIINLRKDLSMKKICAMPNESLEHGGLVDFADSKWLITEIDANDELHANGIMKRCNYLLKWLNHKKEIVEKWCIVEDGTKYLIGEKQADMMAIGDARIAITVPKDKDTNEIHRGMRFLVDDFDSADVLAYQITKPNKLFNVYDGKGVFRFILNEVNSTSDDNFELRIADYYNNIEPEVKPEPIIPPNPQEPDIPVNPPEEEGGWL